MQMGHLKGHFIWRLPIFDQYLALPQKWYIMVIVAWVTWPTIVSSCQTTALCRHSNTCCQLDVQQFWRHDLCRRRTTSLEQSAAQSQTIWAVTRPVQAVTEDICTRTVRPRRSVNSDYMGCHTASSGGYWRHLYSDSEATAQRELL